MIVVDIIVGIIALVIGIVTLYKAIYSETAKQRNANIVGLIICLLCVISQCYHIFVR